MAGEALAVASFGVRGSGKTAWMKRFFADAPRLALWDYKGDPSLDGYGTPYTDLGKFIRALQAPTVRARYLVKRGPTQDAQFDLFCRACFRVGNLAMWVDELAMTTLASRAPDAWRECVNVGRDYRVAGARKWLTVGFTAQRPAEVDKSVRGNLNILHCGRLTDSEDAKLVAKTMGVPAERIMGLPNLHYLEWRDDSGVHAGKLTFQRNAKMATIKKIADVRGGA